MIKLKVASHVNDTDDQMQVRMDFRLEKLIDGKLTYSMFKDQTDEMGNLTAIFKSDSNKYKDLGGKLLRDAKNMSRDNLNQFVKLFNTEIEVAANKLGDDESARAFAKGTGADVHETKSTTKKVLDFLAVPADFIVENDTKRTGACLAKWKASKGTRNYLLEEVDDAGTVKNTYYITGLFLLIEGTASNVKKTYRLRAIGANGVVSEYTEDFSVWVR